MSYSIYRNSDDDASSKAGRILGLARCGIAASETSMNIELIDNTGFQSLFEAIAVLANEVLGETMDMEALAPKPDKDAA